MSHPQKHTLVRISLRSMLAITFGVAVVMAVAGPHINALEPEKKWQLLITLISMVGGMAITTLFIARQRHQAGQQCGPLLVSLAKEMKNRNKKWMRWLSLLIFAPLMVINFSGAASSYSPVQPFYVKLIRFSLLPALYSLSMTHLCLALWAEGYSQGIKLCANGILHANKFYAWNSSALRDMYWGQSGEKLVINIKRAPITTPVPPEQREAVEAILENYYRPNRPSKP